MLGKADGGSWVEDCSELEGGSAKREGLPLLLVSLVKTADWLLPLLWMGLEVQSSPGCFFWMSADGRRTRLDGVPATVSTLSISSNTSTGQKEAISGLGSSSPCGLNQHSPTFFCASDRFNVRQYFQRSAINMWQINKTKEHDMSIMKTGIF